MPRQSATEILVSSPSLPWSGTDWSGSVSEPATNHFMSAPPPAPSEPVESRPCASVAERVLQSSQDPLWVSPTTVPKENTVDTAAATKKPIAVSIKPSPTLHPARRPFIDEQRRGECPPPALSQQLSAAALSPRLSAPALWQQLSEYSLCRQKVAFETCASTCGQACVLTCAYRRLVRRHGCRYACGHARRHPCRCV